MTLLKRTLPGLLAFSLVLAGTATSAGIFNRDPRPEEVGYLPPDGAAVAVNPPPLAWVEEPEAVSYNLELSRDATFTSPSVAVAGHPYLLYTHTAALEPGIWYWRYAAVKSGGAATDWSIVRSFTVEEDVPAFPRPSSTELVARVPREHPRMFVRPDGLELLRTSTTTATKAWNSLKAQADRALTSTIMEEPRPWTGGKWNADEWRAYLVEAGPAVQAMETLAFTFLLTGEKRYAEAAKQRLLEYAKWDPLGTSSMKVNDEVGMPMLHGMSRTYSWIHDMLSPEERTRVREHMAARGEETFKRLRRKPYEQYAYDSHAGRMFHFLGEAGLAFYGEIPAAAEWLDYAITIFYGWYPIWGDSHGGWAEGIAYWSSYNSRVTWWLDQMKTVLGLRGTDKPFYAHAGDFPMFVVPPGNPVSGFGDMSERGQSASVGPPMTAYAKMQQNSSWQWYADSVGAGSGTGPIAYLRALQPAPEAIAPADAPLLKLFPGAGYALFNTDLVSSEKNIHLAMRSSPFGNISHSHNDQNAIVLAAFGEPLLVNTGTRDYYGSRFCKEYYWHTRSHNAVLIGNEGQPRSPRAKGKFLRQGEGENLAWVVGDATAAYEGLATLARRWAILAHQEVVVLVDEIQTTAPRVELLFHARAPFETDDGGTQFLLKKGKVSLHGYLFTDADVSWAQTNEYPLQPAPRTKLVPEWHLTAEVSNLSRGGKPLRVISVLVPEKVGSSAGSSRISHVYAEPAGSGARISWQKEGMRRSMAIDYRLQSAVLE